MDTIPLVLEIVASLVNFVLFIVVVARMFKVKGILHGFLGLICSLYAFIWGWMVSKEQNLRNVMIAWSLTIVISILLGYISNAMSGL